MYLARSIQVVMLAFLSIATSGGLHAAVVDFTDGGARGLSDRDLAGNAWADQGVTFTGMRWFGSGCGVGPACLYEGNLTSEMSMSFTQDVSSAGFLFLNPNPRDEDNPANFTFTATASNDGANVASLTFPNQLGGYTVAFSGMGAFDKIVLSGDSSGWNLGTLEFSPVPIPAAAWLFASALGFVGYSGWRRKKA
jgi:hypothetical protein